METGCSAFVCYAAWVFASVYLPWIVCFVFFFWVQLLLVVLCDASLHGVSTFCLLYLSIYRILHSFFVNGGHDALA